MKKVKGLKQIKKYIASEDMVIFNNQENVRLFEAFKKINVSTSQRLRKLLTGDIEFNESIDLNEE